VARRLSAWAYVSVAAAWAAWLIALPWCLERRTLPPWLVAVAAWTYRIAGWVCHQDPARSFLVGAWPMPVCARCSGLYMGATVGAVAGLWMARRAAFPGSPGRVPLRTVRLTLIVAAWPTVCLWAAEWVVRLPVTNMGRLAGALPLGAAISWLIVIVLRGVLLTDKAQPSGVH
jgi:hypothetical protein